MKDNELLPLEIDLEKLKGDQLDESFLTMWGSWIQTILKRMFGGGTVPVSIRGKQSDLESLAKVLGGEKRYMASYMKHGLNNPAVLKNRHALERAVYNFERDTGIKWPLK
jgi:hypothetical protein|tara:strand:- start:860 stop:1189 length:330 start_codon:yes stop_codon:yes gene_type:complete